MFGCFCQCFVTTRNLVQNGLNWCNQCTSLCHKVASEFFAANAPSPPHWTLNSCFGAFLSFGCIWQCFIITRNSVQNGLNINGQVCTMKSHRKFFATNTPDPPHWTLNSWLRAFHSVLVYFGLFRYCTKVDAMRAEMLMHKFVPWSRVRIFQNERIRSTQLNPKLMFWFVS